MRDLHLDLMARGGIARVRSLMTLGHTAKQLSRAVRSGAFSRPRHGWIATLDAEPTAFRAVQLGGRLASTSALTSYGVWVDHAGPLTVAVPRNASRLISPDVGERRIWAPDRFPTTSGIEWRVSVLDALLQSARGATASSLIASVDSAMHLGLIGGRDLGALAAHAPSRHRLLPSRADRRAESGNETHLRLALRDVGLLVDAQVELPLIGRVDLLVDGWLIVEVDSRAHHETVADQDRDRRRDGNAVLIGYAVVRFMPESIATALDWCVDVVLARLRQGRPVTVSGGQRAARGILT
ncbi:type IV toxin-antitoxin system AbiEi family antitoxin domain-containing protein [soil metagenome]